MALSAERLERIPQKLLKNGLVRLSSTPLPSMLGAEDEEDVELEQALHTGQLLRGGVVELSVSGGAALGTTLSLHACRYAQEQSQKRYGQNVWCAFVDPSGSLYAPGVASLGVDTDRLLVVRPDEKSLSRVALRLVEAQVFPVVVIDTMGALGAQLEVSLARWVPVVRRLNRAIEGSMSTVILITDQRIKRPLPLPVAQRFEVTRTSLANLSLRVARSSIRKTEETTSKGITLSGLRSCRLSARQILQPPKKSVRLCS